jgi:hypothetical protein
MRFRFKSTWNSHHHHRLFRLHRNHPHNPLHLQRDTHHRLLTTFHYVLPNTWCLQNLSFNMLITTLFCNAYRIRPQGNLHYLLVNGHNRLSNLCSSRHGARPVSPSLSGAVTPTVAIKPHPPHSHNPTHPAGSSGTGAREPSRLFTNLQPDTPSSPAYIIQASHVPSFSPTTTHYRAASDTESPEGQASTHADTLPVLSEGCWARKWEVVGGGWYYTMAHRYGPPYTRTSRET